VVFLATPNDIDITRTYEVEQSAENTRGDASKTRIRFRPVDGDEEDAVCVELDRSVAPKFTKDPTKKEEFSGKEIKDSGSTAIPCW
jgi:hypothetical protein